MQFDREAKGEIEARKKAAQEPLEYVTEVCRVCQGFLAGRYLNVKLREVKEKTNFK